MLNKDILISYAQDMCQAGFDKKAEDIVILDMEGVSDIADYFLILSGKNYKMTQSIADEMKDKAEELGLVQKHIEGYKEGEWILVDFGDLVCHIFTKDQREFYGLDALWNDAKRIQFEGV